MRFVVPIVVLAGLVALFAIGLNRDPTLVPSPLIGKHAPAFDLPVLSGKPKRMTAMQLRGRPVLVNFFASWCVDCKIEQPYLLQLAQQHHVPIYGIDYKDTVAAVRGMLSTLGNPYRKIILDRDGNMGINWGVYGVPETFVLDAHGVIRYKQIGPLTPRAWRLHIKPLLKASS